MSQLVDFDETNKYIAQYRNLDVINALSNDAMFSIFAQDTKVQSNIKKFETILGSYGVTKIDDITKKCSDFLIPSMTRSKLKQEYFNSMILGSLPDLIPSDYSLYTLRFPDGIKYTDIPIPSWSIKHNDTVLIAYSFLKFNKTANAILDAGYQDVVVVVSDMPALKLNKDGTTKKISAMTFDMCLYQNTGKLILVGALQDFITKYFKN
jgi:hypothetical protein